MRLRELFIVFELSPERSLWHLGIGRPRRSDLDSENKHSLFIN
jgi:hypothetical protein